MSLSIRTVGVSGDWTPLLSALPGWRMSRPGVWTEGVSEVRVDPAGAEQFPRFSFTALPGAILEIAGEARILRSPTGIQVGLIEGGPDAPGERVSPVLMNHVAVHVPELATERAWYEGLLGRCTVLERERAWEPVSRSFYSDVHLFRPHNYYITLRGGFERAFVDHVGWMVDTTERVKEVTMLLRDIGWPIVFGPEEIDGSYLVHFRGPDARVHDFFYPTPSVRPDSGTSCER